MFIRRCSAGARQPPRTVRTDPICAYRKRTRTNLAKRLLLSFLEPNSRSLNWRNQTLHQQRQQLKSGMNYRTWLRTGSYLFALCHSISHSRMAVQRFTTRRYPGKQSKGWPEYSRNTDSSTLRWMGTTVKREKSTAILWHRLQTRLALTNNTASHPLVPFWLQVALILYH